MNQDFALPDVKVQNYRSVRGAEAYRHDHQTKLLRRWSTRRELRIYARLFARLAGIETVLDLPAGHGRLLPLLRARFVKVIEADFSREMLQLNARDHGAAPGCLLQCSALDIPLLDRAVDLAFSIRLSHHLESVEARHRHLGELFRVADRAVIVSWFSTTSLKNRLRQLRSRFRPLRQKNTLRLDEVRGVAERSGFVLVERHALSLLSSGHDFALFLRER